MLIFVDWKIFISFFRNIIIRQMIIFKKRKKNCRDTVMFFPLSDSFFFLVSLLLRNKANLCSFSLPILEPNLLCLLRQVMKMRKIQCEKKRVAPRKHNTLKMMPRVKIDTNAVKKISRRGQLVVNFGKSRHGNPQLRSITWHGLLCKELVVVNHGWARAQQPRTFSPPFKVEGKVFLNSFFPTPLLAIFFSIFSFFIIVFSLFFLYFSLLQSL